LETQSLVFILVMAAIAAAALVAFGVHLVVRRVASGAQATAPGSARAGARWFEYLLAVLALVAVVVAVIVIIVFLYPGGMEGGDSWRGDTRSLVFLVAMLVIGTIALIAFLVGMIVRRQPTTRDAGAVSGATDPEPSQTPGGTRLLGLAALVLGFLVLNWTFVDRVDQYRLMVYLLYPAVLGVSLVLLFDKATRSWSIKGKGEPFREWVFCDAATFLLFLGFLNLVRYGGNENYNVLFWDLLNLVLFFFTFWLLDRKVTRYRFLVAYGYFTIIPLLLQVWRMHRGLEVPEDVSWWSSVWPFAVLALIFLVIEIIALIATRGTGRHGGGPARDTIFVILFAVLLLRAIP